MDASVEPEEQVLPEREPGESPSFASWNLVWKLATQDEGRDRALGVGFQDVDTD